MKVLLQHIHLLPGIADLLPWSPTGLCRVQLCTNVGQTPRQGSEGVLALLLMDLDFSLQGLLLLLQDSDIPDGLLALHQCHITLSLELENLLAHFLELRPRFCTHRLPLQLERSGLVLCRLTLRCDEGTLTELLAHCVELSLKSGHAGHCIFACVKILTHCDLLCFVLQLVACNL